MDDKTNNQRGIELTTDTPKFTGGLWDLNAAGEICTRDNIIANVIGFDDCGPGDTYEAAREEIAANGALLAAAPMLFYALRGLVLAHLKDVPEQFPHLTLIPALEAALAALEQIEEAQPGDL